jgi:SAM-dependent methyltransferase
MDRAYIPSKGHMHSTSDVDGVNTAFGYWGPFSYPMRARLNMVIRSLRRKSGYHRILDAGYGCGIMLADLYRRLSPAGELYGVDIHGEHDGTYRCLIDSEGMERDRVHLHEESLDALPFEDGSFDLVVSVSVLEHIPVANLDACLRELARVASPEAQIVLGFPTDGLFIRLLSWAQSTDLRANHPSTHTDIFAALDRAGLKILDKSVFPPLSRDPLAMHYNVSVVSEA